MKSPLLPRTSAAGAALILSGSLAFTSVHPAALAQEPLDPVRDPAGAPLEQSIHQPLPEQYIWTALEDKSARTDRIVYKHPGVDDLIEPHFFRTTFSLTQVPPHATLYIAGPRSIEAYVNGKLAERVDTDVTHPITTHVFAVPVESLLKPGRNTLAVKVVRGRGVTGYTNSALAMQQASGQIVVAKIIPREPGIMAPALMISGPGWKSSINAPSGWETAGFDDHGWADADALGGIESTLDLYQWNADAGMYDWPGYDGISPFLAHRRVPVASIKSQTNARGSIENASAITSTSASAPVIVHLPATALASPSAPNLVLDFGRELTGRLELVSDSDTTAQVTIQYGESYDEMLKAPYLGVNLLSIAPHTTGHGPKTSFRYVKLAFVGGGPDLRFRSIAADDIFYPVKYQGSFESSDPVLNRIWEVGAYTAHLCMQDDVWDSPKRDRGRWMGDTDVMGRTIEDVFDDHFLMEDTLDRLLGTAPVQQHVNGIPGYSAFWFTGVAQYYRQTGNKAFLEKTHERMLQLLAYVDKEFDQQNVYANKTNVWLYVDWSPELNGDTPESRRATTLEFYGAYRDAAFLLRELGDTANADHYEQRAAQIRAGAQKALLNPSTNTFGPRWQTNAAAVLYGVADPSQYNAIWNSVLSSVGHVRFNSLVVTPYYNYYVISAMAKLGHREDALQWMRAYWGGMIAEGATSFWEAYDPDWFKEDFHASLQADNRSGYFVSLAHGWSSGATPWLMEQVLGIQSTGAGFSTVSIRPDLIDLQWARGAEPTPRGLLKVSATRENGGTITVDLPPGTQASVSIPLPHPGAAVTLNGQPTSSQATENGTRAVVSLTSAGSFVLKAQ